MCSTLPRCAHAVKGAAGQGAQLGGTIEAADSRSTWLDAARRVRAWLPHEGIHDDGP